jgi:ribA/ribD-fused uncharacterized protein
MIDSFTGRWNFLSNFFLVEIEHQGIKYPSVEHYYVAMKIKNDQQIDGKYIGYVDCRELISKIKSPGDVKRFGRNKISLRKDWNDIKLSVMEWALREKFKDESLKEMLLSTGDEELIEGNSFNDVYCTYKNKKLLNNRLSNYDVNKHIFVGGVSTSAVPKPFKFNAFRRMLR